MATTRVARSAETSQTVAILQMSAWLAGTGTGSGRLTRALAGCSPGVRPKTRW